MTHSIEVSFSPALFPFRKTEGKQIIVVIDVLRFTTSLVAAFDSGVEAVIPVGSLEEARELKQHGYLVAAERDGLKLDFADFGNSATDFLNPGVKGKTIAYSTTNGTTAMVMAAESGTVVSAAFTNLIALSEWLKTQETNIVILCSGWKNLFSIEDTLCAGALATRLTEMHSHTTTCDSAIAAMDYWRLAKNNPEEYIAKASHHQRLVKLGVDPMLLYTLQTGISASIPVFENGRITDKRPRP